MSPKFSHRSRRFSRWQTPASLWFCVFTYLVSCVLCNVYTTQTCRIYPIWLQVAVPTRSSCDKAFIAHPEIASFDHHRWSFDLVCSFPLLEDLTFVPSTLRVTPADGTLLHCVTRQLSDLPHGPRFVKTTVRVWAETSSRQWSQCRSVLTPWDLSPATIDPCDWLIPYRHP